ncbi:MAG: glutathione S-transferase family protein [Phenylobacterium sp.]|nr:MAG: glutathione S-transferase family protein [Phenylobacterium sp.]
MAEIILHHYDTSPFSEKPRVMFGIKGLAWRSVIQPVIMPKPDLIPLTGGYRRIPVMQIGADVYCDSQVILAEIERRAPEPRVARGADWAANIWADRLFFQATVAVVFGAIGDHVPKEFIEDREKLSGRPFDMAAMKAAAGPMKAQWRAQAAWIEDGLGSNDFLGGSTPSLADIAAYMNVWWLSGAARSEAAALLAGLPRVTAWRARMTAIGHGARSEMSGAEALDAARTSDPAAAPPHDDADSLGLIPGEAVSVSSDDYGRDPIEGRLVAVTPDQVIIARTSTDLGRVHVHFPRFGYIVARA